MAFVLRHLNLLSRPSSIKGHQWEEVHEPELKLDVKVGLSCLLFLAVAAALHACGDVEGAAFFLLVTTLSTLSDAVIVSHYFLDLTDRISALFAVLYMLWFCTQWFMLHSDWAQLGVWAKLFSQLFSGVVPFHFLDQCRKHPVRSEPWRQHHVNWHISGTLAMLYSIWVSQGHADNLLFSGLAGPIDGF
mmetsp:Transcript_15895/g.44971  ORF Transcript_15895/g.44971 Transcript_15895/m.44971 type:complete len:189 (+) Transcript_15895:104-670(+)